MIYNYYTLDIYIYVYTYRIIASRKEDWDILYY